MTISGAGLTSVMSCPAAEVMSDPAARMSGFMRGSSDSRVNFESGEGIMRELAVTAASICSTDDWMMLARAFKSAKTFGDTLSRSILSDSPSSAVHVRYTLRQDSGRWVLKRDPKRGETLRMVRGERWMHGQIFVQFLVAGNNMLVSYRIPNREVRNDPNHEKVRQSAERRKSKSLAEVVDQMRAKLYS
jgi:hypothetical protein